MHFTCFVFFLIWVTKAHLFVAGETSSCVRTPNAASKCPGLIKAKPKACNDCYNFCGSDVLSCNTSDLWNLKCTKELVMGCTDEKDGVPTPRPVARPAAPPVPRPVSPPVPRPVPRPVVRPAPVALTVARPVASPLRRPVAPPVARPAPVVQPVTRPSGGGGNKSCTRTSNAKTLCPELMETAAGDCDSCYYFCGSDLLSCDLRDLWNLKCSKVLVMGCTEDDLATSGRKLRGDDTSDVSSLVLQDEVPQKAVTVNSGAIDPGTGFASLVLALVVALAA